MTTPTPFRVRQVTQHRGCDMYYGIGLGTLVLIVLVLLLVF